MESTQCDLVSMFWQEIAEKVRQADASLSLQDLPWFKKKTGARQMKFGAAAELQSASGWVLRCRTLQQSDTEKATRNEQLSMLPVALPTDPQVGWQLGCLPMASYAGAMQGRKNGRLSCATRYPLAPG